MTQPSESDARAIVTRALGTAYSVVKLSGYWVIGTTTDGRWQRVSPEPLRRSLTKAIEDVRIGQHARGEPRTVQL